VKEVWGICDSTREYVQRQGREIPPQEMLEKVSMPSLPVDVERTKREAGFQNAPTKIF
jgi:hypothetical protein